MSKTEERKAAIAERWQYYRTRKSQRKRNLVNHESAFRVDDVGAGWEYVHFELDGKTVGSYRVSYIGPGVRDFVETVTHMKEKDYQEVVFCSEPGEYVLQFSRRGDNIYVWLPSMEDGFFLKYDAFVDQVTEEFNRVYG